MTETKDYQSPEYGPVCLVYADAPLSKPGAQLKMENYSTNKEARERYIELSKTEACLFKTLDAKNPEIEIFSYDYYIKSRSA